MRSATISESYAAALREYLEDPNEEHLSRAYELGRAAIERDGGLLELIAAHRDIVGNLVHEDVSADQILMATAFLAEAATPFEMTFRGYREANESLREQTEELREAYESLEQFSHSVAHDIRAPLRSIQGLAGVLLEDFGTEMTEEAGFYATRIVEGGRRLDRLVNDILAYSKVSRAELALEPVPLRTAVDGAIAQLGSLIQESGCRITIAVESDAVVAHPQTLEQIIVNLVSNAIKFAKPGATANVDVTSESARRHVRLIVVDDGIGVAPEDHDRIFAMLSRLHSEDKYPGTGIGLAIVRRAVDRMGGKVGLESEAGEGSRFWIELPAAKQRPRNASG
ncbi:MAG: ATP-binding protein [Actinomycetota bacterium]